MSRERKPVQLQPGTFKVLMALRERIFELEGRPLTVDETIQVALAGMTEAPLPPSYDADLRHWAIAGASAPRHGGAVSWCELQ